MKKLKLLAHFPREEYDEAKREMVRLGKVLSKLMQPGTFSVRMHRESDGWNIYLWKKPE